ncbi:MAG TPA: response regulator transcription factor [Candidatus Limnocylindria bacterium]|jgi:two-component system KDP operon response regulator KdpE
MSRPTGARVLVVDDEDAVRRIVVHNLEAHGFRVASADSGEDALDIEPRFHPDLVVLDLGLPELDGFAVIEALRERSSTPILVLSVRGAEADKVRALDLGADDYLTKPFGVQELLARVRVALRHAARRAGGAEAVFRTGALRVDLEKRQVTLAGAEVHLTPTEYALLTALVADAGAVLTDRALLRRVWGPEYGDENHYVHVYMARLRKKLEADPTQPRYIRTEAGVGYRLVEDPAPDTN